LRNLRRVVLLCTAALLIAAVPATSSAVAYNKKERRAEKKQNQRVKKLARDIRAARTLLNTLNRTVGGTKLTELGTKLTGVDNRLKAIEGAAPQIVAGLNALKAGSLALKTNLEKAGAGLDKLAKGAGAQEYGIGQVVIGATPAAGSFVVTPDIPDFVQQATVTSQFVAGGAGPISLQVGVRSGENDGTGASLPAAHCRMTILDDAGAFATSSPNAAFNNLPFYPIEQKSTLTSTVPANAGFPFGPKTSGTDADVLTNLTAAGNSTGTATATAGQEYTVTLTCVDVSPSTDPDDPDTEA
jgi:hypothetical protein